MKSPHALVRLLAFASIMLASPSVYAEYDTAMRIGAARAALGTNWGIGDLGHIMRLDGCRKEARSLGENAGGWVRPACGNCAR